MPSIKITNKKDNEIEEKTVSLKDTEVVNNNINNICLDYHIITNKSVDRSKTYYSAFFKCLILFTDFEAKSYNILQRYNPDNNTYNYYVCLYEEEIQDSIKLKKDYSGGYKIFTYNIIPNANKDINIDIEFIEDRDNPKARIFRIH